MTDKALLTEDERALWRSTYAAAFVGEFEHLATEVTPYTAGSRYVSRFELAARGITAERAVTIADLAVHRLRQWRVVMAQAGRGLRKLPDEWDEP